MHQRGVADQSPLVVNTLPTICVGVVAHITQTQTLSRRDVLIINVIFLVVEVLTCLNCSRKIGIVMQFVVIFITS